MFKNVTPTHAITFIHIHLPYVVLFRRDANIFLVRHIQQRQIHGILTCQKETKSYIFGGIKLNIITKTR